MHVGTSQAASSRSAAHSGPTLDVGRPGNKKMDEIKKFEKYYFITAKDSSNDGNNKIVEEVRGCQQEGNFGGGGGKGEYVLTHLKCLNKPCRIN